MQKAMNEIYFSQLRGRRIYDGAGKAAGKVNDVVVRWDGGMPYITGIRHSGDIHRLIPASQVKDWAAEEVQLCKPLAEIEIADINEQELYVGKWLLDKQIIDLNGSKLVRVNDILLSCSQMEGQQQLFLLAADIGMRGLIRRLGLEFLVRRVNNHYILWQSITPLESRTASLKLNLNKEQVSKLHPADIADLVEEMDYNSRAVFIKSLDVEQAAEALAEMELDTQVEIITQLDGHQASDLLEEMPPDEAADILSEMPEGKSSELLLLMETDEAEEVKELMQYEEDTAGGLMTTEYIGLSVELTAEQAIQRVRELAPGVETIYYLYVIDTAEKLLGVFSLRELIIAQTDMVLGDLMHTKIVTVHHDDSHRKVADAIHKYGLLAVPVTDETGVLCGIITVDDVLDILMPERSVSDAMSVYLSKRALREG